jgi:hypothetical protein
LGLGGLFSFLAVVVFATYRHVKSQIAAPGAKTRTIL